MDELLVFGSSAYWTLFCILAASRGADFLSTWIATPTLMLEANPVAKWLGWKRGIFLNALLCAGFALWPLPAIVIATASTLVAARNLQSAWIMRSFGEINYRCWVAERLGQTSLRLYLFCLFGQSLLLAALGGALVLFSRWQLVPFAIGVGIITYAIAITLYTSLSVWRIRRTYR